MSITAKLQELEAAGELILYRPHLKPHERQLRNLYMTKGAHLFCPPTGNSAEPRMKGEALAATRAQLSDFVTGEPMEYDLDFKWLEPRQNNVWELRTLQRPMARLFGWFPCPNTFVVTNCKMREDLKSTAWRRAIERSIKEREAMLPGAHPFCATEWQYFVTSNAIGDLNA